MSGLATGWEHIIRTDCGPARARAGPSDTNTLHLV